MMAVVEREDLVTGMSWVLPVVSRNAPLPIQSNLCLESGDGFMDIRAQDATMDLRARVALRQEGESVRTTVHAGRFSALVRALPDGARVRLETDGALLVVQHGRGVFRFATLPIEQYPEAPQVRTRTEIRIARAALKRMLEVAVRCCDRDGKQPYMRGVHVSADADGALTCTATDGLRIAQLKGRGEVVKDDDGPLSALIPTEAAQLMIRQLDGESAAAVTLLLETNRVGMQAAGALLSARTIEGRYPDVSRIIGNGRSISLGVAREALKEVLAMARPMISHAVEGQRLDLLAQPESGLSVEIIGENKETAFKADVTCATQGRTIRMAVSLGLLSSAVDCVQGEEVLIEVDDVDTPMLVRDPDVPDELIVLSPMRI